MSATVHMHGNLRRFLCADSRPHDHGGGLVAVNGAAREKARVLQDGDLLNCLNLSPVDEGARDESPVRDHDVERGGSLAYEKWVREYDYKVAKSLPSIVSHTTHRMRGPSTGRGCGLALHRADRDSRRRAVSEEFASPADRS
jgi:hypothetical protein